MTDQRLPIFPLGMVLFPGTVAPLHLFEPRYRQLLADIRDGDRRFGLVCIGPGVNEPDLPPGTVGCIAEVTDIEMMPDGRSNIVVVGRERFAIDRFLDHHAPYHVVHAVPVNDTGNSNPVALAVTAGEVTSNFRRVVSAVHTLNDDASPPPALPDDPAQLPWTIGAMIDLDLQARQALLAERSPMLRLTTIDAVLRKVLPDLELQAAMHRR